MHYWDRPHDVLRWTWLDADAQHPYLSDISFLKDLKVYTTPQYLKDIVNSGVVKAVHVEAARGTPDPIAETSWVQAQADATGWPHAIVASANLRDAAIEVVLGRQATHSLFRGVRVPASDLEDAGFQRGYELLDQFDLVCEVGVTWEKMPTAASLAQRFPATQMIINHAGFPMDWTPEYFEQWSAGVRTLAAAENVVMKISSLGMCQAIDNGIWTIESIEPFVHGCIESFGPSRCMLGTNWPVDKMFSSYADLIGAYRELIAEYSAAEQEAMLRSNAMDLYRL